MVCICEWVFREGFIEIVIVAYSLRELRDSCVDGRGKGILGFMCVRYV